MGVLCWNRQTMPGSHFNQRRKYQFSLSPRGIRRGSRNKGTFNLFKTREVDSLTENPLFRMIKYTSSTLATPLKSLKLTKKEPKQINSYFLISGILYSSLPVKVMLFSATGHLWNTFILLKLTHRVLFVLNSTPVDLLSQ